MAQPPTYDRQYSFDSFQASTPDDPLPSAKVELELNTIKITLDAILANLALIQRDDGALANLSVGAEQLAVSLRTGINAPTVWTVAPTAYAVNDTVVYISDPRSELWLCVTAHTSTTDFDTDSLVSLYWTKLADFSFINFDAASAAYDNTASALTATDVQAAIDELDAALDGLSVGGTLTDADYGDITVSGTGTVLSINAGAVDATALAADAVTTVKILDANVTTAKIANLSITTALLNAGAVTAAKLAANAVTTSKILDANVTTAKVADNAITLAKIADATQGDILYYGAAGAPAVLGAGTSGQFLKTLGAGADPAWATSPGAVKAVTVFTASGTWTPNANSTTAIILATGGGEGGVDGVASTSGGRGGVSGKTSIHFVADTSVVTGTVTIGAAGASNGGNGGDTSVDAICVAPGGGSVTAQVGTMQLASGDGQAADINGNDSVGGLGGASFWGGPGAYGAGGDGGVDTGSGDAGTAGAVLVIEW